MFVHAFVLITSVLLGGLIWESALRHVDMFSREQCFPPGLLKRFKFKHEVMSFHAYELITTWWITIWVTSTKRHFSHSQIF